MDGVAPNFSSSSLQSSSFIINILINSSSIVLTSHLNILRNFSPLHSVHALHKKGHHITMGPLLASLPSILDQIGTLLQIIFIPASSNCQKSPSLQLFYGKITNCLFLITKIQSIHPILGPVHPSNIIQCPALVQSALDGTLPSNSTLIHLHSFPSFLKSFYCAPPIVGPLPLHLDDVAPRELFVCFFYFFLSLFVVNPRQTSYIPRRGRGHFPIHHHQKSHSRNKYERPTINEYEHWLGLALCVCFLQHLN